MNGWLKLALIGGGIALVVGGLKSLNDTANQVEGTLNGMAGKKGLPRKGKR